MTPRRDMDLLGGAPVETRYELPGVYRIGGGQVRPQRRPQIAAGGLVVTVLLAVVAIAAAAWAGVELRP